MRTLSKILFYLGILLANLIICNRGNTKDNSNRDEVAVELNTPNKELVKSNDGLRKEMNL